MPTYYVGLGGNDANSGLSWAARKLTLNGAENVPVVAGDTIYVAPGVYREMLTLDVSGAAGSPITYIGDVSGENTDSVGGVVRITGSDNDQTVTRTNCILASVARDYRTFRGFSLDTATASLIAGMGENWTIEDCTMQSVSATCYGILVTGATQNDWIIRRCRIMIAGISTQSAIEFQHTVTVDNANHLVEDCILSACRTTNNVCLASTRVGGITCKHCTLIFFNYGVRVRTALTVGQTIIVNNCTLSYGSDGLTATVLGEIVENYNSIIGVSAPRTNVAVGANSNAYFPLFDLGILHSGASQVSGFRFPPPLFGTLSQWSQIRAIADTGAATEDILGLSRPVTAGKRSWGAVQYVDMARDTATVHAGTASKKLADAGRDQIYVPTTNISTVFSVYVYREANYAGVNPQMIIKQPGQADTVITDAGAAGAWNLLTATLAPAALPGYVVIELVSNNTAAAGNYATYFDDLTVT